MLFFQGLLRNLGLSDYISIDKSWFDDPIFWSAKDGQELKAENIILLAIENSPRFITIAKLYQLFGEKLIVEAFNKHKHHLDDRTQWVFRRGLKMAKEILGDESNEERND